MIKCAVTIIKCLISSFPSFPPSLSYLTYNGQVDPISIIIGPSLYSGRARCDLKKAHNRSGRSELPRMNSFHLISRVNSQNGPDTRMARMLSGSWSKGGVTRVDKAPVPGECDRGVKQELGFRKSHKEEWPHLVLGSRILPFRRNKPPALKYCTTPIPLNPPQLSTNVTLNQGQVRVAQPSGSTSWGLVNVC